MHLTALKRPLLILSLLLLIAGCYPTTEVVQIPVVDFPHMKLRAQPVKAMLFDGTILLFPAGCGVVDDTLLGMGSAYGLRDLDTVIAMRRVPLSDIAAMTYYKHQVTSSRFAASVILGATGAVMLPNAVHCLSCPKCCFGSCPTVYTYNDTSSVLEAELFSSSISPLYEECDIDRIGSNLAVDGTLNLRITNEALETHYINAFELAAVAHPEGTRCYPQGNAGFCIVGPSVSPQRAASKSGVDVLPLLASAADSHYRTGDTLFKDYMAVNEMDWIETSVDVPAGATKAVLVLRMKNSLLSTVLFYDMVLGSQGLDALEWTEKITADPEYAEAFRSVYNTFSGISIKVRRNGKWTEAGAFHDAGPISWKESALEIPIDRPGPLVVRLQFFPDNFLIDNIAFGFSDGTSPEFTITTLEPQSIIGNGGEPRDDALRFIAGDDSLYLETNPGDAYRLTYRIPDSPGMESTLFVRSKGYYTEWIRGKWLANNAGPYRFNLYDIQGTLSELTKRWQEDRVFLERSFFESRIPVREVK